MSIPNMMYIDFREFFHYYFRCFWAKEFEVVRDTDIPSHRELAIVITQVEQKALLKRTLVLNSQAGKPQEMPADKESKYQKMNTEELAGEIFNLARDNVSKILSQGIDSSQLYFLNDEIRRSVWQFAARNNLHHLDVEKLEDIIILRWPELLPVLYETLSQEEKEKTTQFMSKTPEELTNEIWISSRIELTGLACSTTAQDDYELPLTSFWLEATGLG